MKNQFVAKEKTLEIATEEGILISETVQESKHKNLPITILCGNNSGSDLAYERMYSSSGKEGKNTLYVSESPSIFELTERMIALEKEFGHHLWNSNGSINILTSDYSGNFVSEIEKEFLKLIRKGERPDLVLIDSWPANEDLECLEETISDMQEYLGCEVVITLNNKLLQ